MGDISMWCRSVLRAVPGGRLQCCSYCEHDHVVVGQVVRCAVGTSEYEAVVSGLVMYKATAISCVHTESFTLLLGTRYDMLPNC